MDEVVRWAVGANTYRALGGSPAPSQIFRPWATEWFVDRDNVEGLSNVRTEIAYDVWLERLRDALATRWKTERGHDLQYGASRKLTNLLMKWLLRWDDLPANVRGRLLWFVQVPLDRYSLAGLHHCVAELRVPEAPSMGFVRDPFTYRRVQRAIRLIAEAAGVLPIYYDVLCWDGSADKTAHRSGSPMVADT